ncbi:MAG: hypothetical protein KDC79_03650 [Cyclobacteriaceae bacterium]|nr:hypothetical protein [Cyclobacteriaceae bacterium]
MEPSERLHTLEELVAIEMQRLDKMDEQIAINQTWTKIGWIMAGSSMVIAALALYSVFNFHIF